RKPAWRLEEAIAIWLDLNPLYFILHKANPNNWDGFYHPNFLERYRNLLDTAKRYAVIGTLLHNELDGQVYVTPKDFFAWAWSVWGEPDGIRPIQVCKIYGVPEQPSPQPE